MHARRLISHLCLVLFIYLMPFSGVSSAAQKISGVVVDSESGKAIDKVFVMAETGEKTITDKQGRFSLTVSNAEAVELEFTKDGYIELRDRFIVAAGQGQNVNVTLYPAHTYEEEMVVSKAPIPEVESVEFLTPQYVIDAPGAFEDALQSLQVMPGVISNNDYMARLYIRGGRPDQNGIFMDGIPIYDPYRLFGLTSLFNPETIQDIRLYAGGFDAEYGDRLSAVVEVSNRYGTYAKLFTGSANISLTNVNFIAEGRLLKNLPSSWLFAARRTYYDIILNQTDDSGSSYPSFTDFQGIFHFQPNAENQWMVTLLGSDEGTDLTAEEEIVDDADPNEVDVLDDQSNYIAGVNGSHTLDNFMRWSYTLSFTQNKQTSAIDFLEGETSYRTQADQNLINSNTMFQTKYEIFLENHSICAGLFYALSDNKVNFNINTDDPRVDLPDDMRHFTLTQDFEKAGGFIQDAWAATPQLEWKAGLRWDQSTLSGMSEWSPRTSVKWTLNDRWAFRAACGYYYQFPSYESLQGDGFFLDLREIKSQHLKPEQAIHYVLSSEYESPAGWALEADFYYKELSDLLESGEEIETVLILNENDQSEYYTRDSMTFIPENSRSGYARGFDLTFKLLDRPDRSVYGMMTYTYSEARSRKNGEDYVWEDWDRRHGLTWIAGWVLNKRWELGWKWTLGTGFPYTPVTNIIRIVDDLDGDGMYEPDDGETYSYQRDDPEKALRSRRLPTTHRLDFRVQYNRSYKRFDAVYYLDIINLYGSENVYGYYYDAEYTKRYEDTGLPFLPSLGIKIKF